MVISALNLQAGEARAGPAGTPGPGPRGGCALRRWESGGLRAAFAGHPGAPVFGMAAGGRAMGVDALDALLQDILEAFVRRFGERLAAAGGGASRTFKGTRALVWSAYRRALDRSAARALAHVAAGGWLFFAQRAGRWPARRGRKCRGLGAAPTRLPQSEPSGPGVFWGGCGARRPACARGGGWGLWLLRRRERTGRGPDAAFLSRGG